MGVAASWRASLIDPVDVPRASQYRTIDDRLLETKISALLELFGLATSGDKWIAAVREN